MHIIFKILWSIPLIWIMYAVMSASGHGIVGNLIGAFCCYIPMQILLFVVWGDQHYPIKR